MKKSTTAIILVVFFAATMVLPGLSASNVFETGTVYAQATPDCAGGLVHDDGTRETGYGWGAGENWVNAYLVESYTPPAYPFNFTYVCVAIGNVAGDTTLDLDIVFFADDGPGGAPGTLLGSFPFSLTGVDGNYPMFSFPVNVTVGGGAVYIGTHWDSAVEQNFFMGADQSVTTPQQTGYYSETNGAASWNLIESVLPAYQAMFIRAEGAQVTPTAETGDGTAAAEAVPGADLVDLPVGAVVGTFTAETALYYMPQAGAGTAYTMTAGQSLWVAGLDASQTFYKVLLSGHWLWVPVANIGPTYDDVWNGMPLPTTIVE